MRKYKSKIAAAVHEAMQDARDAGAIHKCTMRQFDESCLTRAEMLSAREIQVEVSFGKFSEGVLVLRTHRTNMAAVAERNSSHGRVIS